MCQPESIATYGGTQSVSNQIIQYSYNDIHNHTLRLLAKIQASHYYNAPVRFDYIVGVARGGLLPATILSHHMGIPLRPLSWSTRDHASSVHDENIKEDLRDGKRVLLVDDINDSGKTFVEILEDWEYDELSTLGVVTLASVFQRYSTVLPSNFYSVFLDHDDWIGFPWERK